MAIIITFTVVGFATGFVYRGRIYKNLSVNILEALAYLNLVTLSAVTAQLTNKTRTTLIYSLVGIVFTTTIGVTVYHLHILYIAKSTIWLKVIALIGSQFCNPKTAAETDPSTANITTSSQHPHKIVSKTVIELREPLLEHDH